MGEAAATWKAWKEMKRRQKLEREAAFREQIDQVRSHGVQIVRLTAGQYRVTARGKQADVYPGTHQWRPVGDVRPRRGGLIQVLNYLGVEVGHG